MKSTIVWFQSLTHNLYLKFNDKKAESWIILESNRKKIRNQTRMIPFGLKSETIWQQKLNDNKHMEGEER